MKLQRTRTDRIPDAILTADWHLREDRPVCRMDDFWTAQWEKVDFISDLQKKYGCPVLHAGDLFNHWKPSPHLLSVTINHIPDSFYTIYGNHDLPQHNLELAFKCGVNTLLTARKLEIVEGYHWGEIPTTCPSITIGKRDILMWHIMTYQGKRPWAGCTDPLAAGLLRKYPQYDLILTGHNHKPFTEEYNGRHLVNPGSLTRQDADQVDQIPSIYLWFALDNMVQRVELPHEKDVISREHLDKVAQRDNRIDAFISKLDSDWKAGMSFEQNLEEFFKTNQVRDSVKEIIYKSIE